MPNQPGILNWARWLHKLGLKTGDQPVLLQSVQPVHIAGDLSHLATIPIGHQYLVGGTHTGSINGYATFQGWASRPMRIRSMHLATSTANTAYNIEILPGIGGLLIADDPITPVPFNAFGNPDADFLASDVHWTQGDLGASAGPLLPAVRLAASSTVFFTQPIFVPPGRYFRVSAQAVAQILVWCLIVDHLANERRA